MDTDTQVWYLERARQLVDELEQGNDHRVDQLLCEIEQRHGSELYDELNRLSGQLQSMMSQTGFDSRIADLADKDIPDARQRLHYVIETTEKAANGTLAHVEASLPLCDQIIDFSDAWLRADGQQMGDDNMRRFMATLPARTKEIRQALNDIMMAQSFQDITGQILRQVIDVVCDIEDGLSALVRKGRDGGGGRPASVERLGKEIMGPAVPGCQGAASITDQDEIDDLLSGLGV